MDLGFGIWDFGKNGNLLEMEDFYVIGCRLDTIGFSWEKCTVLGVG